MILSSYFSIFTHFKKKVVAVLQQTGIAQCMLSPFQKDTWSLVMGNMREQK